MLNSRQKEESRPRSGGRKVRVSRGVGAAGDTGVWEKTSGPRVPAALRTLPPPRPVPTRGEPLGSPCVPRTPLRFTMSTAPLPDAPRRACAEPSPSVAHLSKSSESFASHHLTLSLTMERVGPQLRKAGTINTLNLGTSVGSSRQRPTATERRRKAGLAIPHSCLGNPLLISSTTWSGGYFTVRSPRKADSLLSRPLPCNPISTFQRLAGLARSFSSPFSVFGLPKVTQNPSPFPSVSVAFPAQGKSRGGWRLKKRAYRQQCRQS